MTYCYANFLKIWSFLKLQTLSFLLIPISEMWDMGLMRKSLFSLQAQIGYLAPLTPLKIQVLPIFCILNFDSETITKPASHQSIVAKTVFLCPFLFDLRSYPVIKDLKQDNKTILSWWHHIVLFLYVNVLTPVLLPTILRLPLKALSPARMFGFFDTVANKKFQNWKYQQIGLCRQHLSISKLPYLLAVDIKSTIFEAHRKSVSHHSFENVLSGFQNKITWNFA